MKVLKFGGTSVGSIESIIRVISIIEENLAKGEKIAIVYSAMGGVTNRLIDIAKMAASGNDDYREMMKAMEERHFATIRGLIGAKSQSTVFTGIKILFNDLEDILRGTSLIRELTPRTLDLVMSFGERLSTTIVTEALKFRNVKAEYCDARSIIRTNSSYGNAEVDFETSNRLIQEKFASTEATLCITGFIGATTEGITTTLGRGGSDFTASIIGAALNAELIEIWTDVDGIMTADPRKVPNSFTIPTLSYAEAMELSHFGAKVIYPPSLQPAFAKDIPLKVLNTFNTDFEGSLVCRKATNKKYDITGISSIDELALVNIQGSGMIGVAGISSKLFEALSRNQISVVLISQASSEHSICFAIDPRYIDKAKEVLHDTFKEELESGYVDGIEVSRNLSVIAIVGEGMKKSAGISGKLFSVLGKNGINIIAIAQGSSELNISVVISKNDLSKALNAIHGVFFQSEIRNLNLYMVGAGLIGGTLIEQIRQQTDYLQNEKMLRLNIVGISNTKKMLLDPAGISPETWREDLDTMGVKTSLPAFIQRVQELNLPNSVFIDCTSDKDIVHSYNDLLKANVSIVTPNKVANSGSYASYEALRKTALNRGVKFLYETNVGAGLPIINTIQGLIASGDQFLKIEAILSGTLSYIFNNFKPGVKFVDVVREAKEKGYTEPDPRDDLSGTDVGRKILILSREIGMRLEPEDIEIIPLLPEACLAAPTVDDFFEELLKNNDYFENLLSEATAQGGVLRYIATLNEGKATVALRTVGADHPFYSLSGSDNIVSFTTERYKDHPLVIKGSGAGAAVTASGVFADIMSISSYLG